MEYTVYPSGHYHISIMHLYPDIHINPIYSNSTASTAQTTFN